MLKRRRVVCLHWFLQIVGVVHERITVQLEEAAAQIKPEPNRVKAGADSAGAEHRGSVTVADTNVCGLFSPGRWNSNSECVEKCLTPVWDNDGGFWRLYQGFSPISVRTWDSPV